MQKGCRKDWVVRANRGKSGDGDPCGFRTEGGSVESCRAPLSKDPTGCSMGQQCWQMRGQHWNGVRKWGTVITRLAMEAGDDRVFHYLEKDCGGALHDPQVIQERTRKCMFVILEFLPICKWRLELVLFLQYPKHCGAVPMYCLHLKLHFLTRFWLSQK